jgi:predicted ester cyclase
MGRPPTGRSFAVEHVHVYRLEGGRIAEHWGVRDDLGMLRAIGHLN